MPAVSTLAIPSAVVAPLIRWGVSADADLVYRTLAEFGPRSVGELVGSLGLPPVRVRNALDELAGLGAARAGVRDGRRPDEARVWAAAPADLVVPALRARHVEAARARFYLRQRLISIAEVSHLVGEPDLARLDAVRPLYGTARVRARLAELDEQNRHESLTVQPEPVFDAETVRAAAPLDRALAARGVQLRTLGVPAGTEDATGDHERDMIGRGMQYRELPTLPLKLMILDRTTALLPLDPGNPGKGALEVTARSAVEGFLALFLRQWEQARPPEPGAKPTMKLTPRERAIVSLLAEGHTDATTSRELGLSERTIAYTLRSLMDRYGAQNRFQLGLMLGAYATEDVSPPLPTTPDEEQQ